jgi:ribosomal protein L17
MRHGKKINHLGRKSAHRHALLSNMASSLILHKRITTTVAKAKALKKICGAFDHQGEGQLNAFQKNSNVLSSK